MTMCVRVLIERKKVSSARRDEFVLFEARIVRLPQLHRGSCLQDTGAVQLTCSRATVEAGVGRGARCRHEWHDASSPTLCSHLSPAENQACKRKHSVRIGSGARSDAKQKGGICAVLSAALSMKEERGNVVLAVILLRCVSMR